VNLAFRPRAPVSEAAEAAQRRGGETGQRGARPRPEHGDPQGLPGEGKTCDGRPCSTPRALRDWQSKRTIADNRTHSGELD